MDIQRTLDLLGNVLHYATRPIRVPAPNGKTEDADFTLKGLIDCPSKGRLL